jgi:HK97 family phage prohead protease
MNFKQVSHEIKDIDEAKGIIVAYANVYENTDSDGDIMSKGAFNKTVKENSKRIRVLKDHMSTITLGVPLEIDANDPYGLKTVTKFNMNKQVSKDMYTDILLYKENGLNAELSIGFETIKRDEKNKDRINEVRLWEYSFLSSWAANEKALVTDIKGMKQSDVLDLLVKMYNLPYSDLRLKEIENILISLEKKAVDCPKCKSELPINESGMGHMTCSNCKSVIDSNTFNVIEPIDEAKELFNYLTLKGVI